MRLHYPELDGVRGIAIIYVFVSHSSNGIGGMFGGVGQFGVWLFFVLSAFLLSLVFFQKPETIRSRTAWGNYALRRALRIYPMFAATLVATYLWFGYDWNLLWGELFLLTGSFWAIYVEFRAYFILPIAIVVIEFAGRKHDSLPFVLVITYTVAHILLISPVPGYDTSNAYGILFVEYIPLFLFGTLSAWAYTRFKPMHRSTIAWFLGPLLLAATFINQLGTDFDPDYLHTQWIAFGALFAILLFFSIGPSALRNPFLRWCGKISFSAYLLEDFIIEPLSRIEMKPWHYYFLCTLGVVALCSATYWLIERPLARIHLVKPAGSRSSFLLLWR